jgi:hypothetical protein
MRSPVHCKQGRTERIIAISKQGEAELRNRKQRVRHGTTEQMFYVLDSNINGTTPIVTFCPGDIFMVCPP